MKNSHQTNNRFIWIDWMKTLGMYCIIAGHLSVPGNNYIYVFSVPCFFIISGFLSKRESVSNLFWSKTWWNLIVPMFLLFFLNKLFDFALMLVHGTFQVSFLWQMPLNGLLGFHGVDLPAGGLGALWFVYSLIICKMLLQFLPVKFEKSTLVIMSILMLAGAVVLHENKIVVYSSNVNVLLAMPFFTFGYLMRPYKDSIAALRLVWMPLIIVVCGIMVLLCGTYNDTVFLWKCSYGTNLSLCLIGAVSGTTLVYSLARLLQSYLADLVIVIGGGSVIILGLHYVFSLRLYLPLRKHLFPMEDWFLFVDALIVLLAFIPIIKFCKLYIPVVYGKLRK